MAKIDKKTTFLFIANNIETTQEHYDNLLEDTSFTYLKYRLYITTIEENFINKQHTQQHLSKIQLEEIDELETGLKQFKDETIKLMDKTSMILHKKYTKQTKENQKLANEIKDYLNHEQMQMKQQYKETKEQLHQIILKHNQTNITAPTLTPRTSPSTSTDPTTTEELPYFVPRNELTKKCEILRYSFNPKEIDDFLSDREIATTAQYP